MSRKIGQIDVSRTIGQLNVSRIIGQLNVSRKIGQLNVSRKVGQLNVSRKVGQLNVSRKIGQSGQRYRPHDVSLRVADGTLQQNAAVDGDGDVARHLGEHHSLPFTGLQHPHSHQQQHHNRYN